MGMYTKFGFKAKIHPDYVQSVKDGLTTKELTSGRFHVETTWIDNELSLLFPDDIKNYDKEIENFMTWITLFVIPSVEPIAAQWYEQWAVPFLYWKK